MKESDSFDTGSGQLEIVFLGHGTLAMEFAGKSIHIDPVSEYANYGDFKKADLILITHEHRDHMDAAAVKALSGKETRIIVPASVRGALGAGEVLTHYKPVEAAGLSVEAVPAYNVNPEKSKFHPASSKHNGYVLTAGKLRVYIAGDTEPIPEMAKLGRIDIAFLPMNLPYTMTPEQTAGAARTIADHNGGAPLILYPYHYANTDPALLQRSLAGAKGIEVRVRELR